MIAANYGPLSYVESDDRYSARRMRWRLPGLLLVVVAFGAAACGGNDDDDDRAVVRDEPLEHIHGVDATRDGTLFVATHEGLFTAASDGETLSRVGDRENDLMGFAVVDDDRFVASGHPDQRDDLPPHLGLIESTDGGETWDSVSLLGDADLHVLRVSGERVYGFDGVESRLLVSDDGGKTWDSRGATAPLYDLAVDPRDPNRIVAAAERGLYVSTNAGRRWRSINRRLAGYLAWADDGTLFLLDARGSVHRADRTLRRWDVAGDVGGQPAAFSATGDQLLAATREGTVTASDDAGVTWQPRAAP
jgi:hypothetical protein